ncbi:CotH kinase family protein [Flavobacterium sp.]|uniref:CotH kinase family protein n=1 Tax=Flavobacterium sp. TaxID=239 RepID=UPI0039E67676
MRKTQLLYAMPFFFLSFVVQSQNLVINEILASNNNANTDEDGDHQDWLELFNGTPEAISLNGYGLTDNPSQPFKWIFPDYTMAPGEHLLVWCSDKNRTNPAAPLHTNWKISNDGETIRLTNASGVMVDEFPPVVLGSDVSYGRTVSGGPDFTIFQQPTPGAPNSVQSPGETLSPPVFSMASGFFNESFNLTLSHPDPEATILYTLDGSEPDSENLGGKTYQYKNQYPEFPGDPFGELLTASYTTQTYADPLVIEDRSALPNKVSAISTTFFNPYYLPTAAVKKATVVRARAVRPGYSPSMTVTQNYFFSNSTHTLPVVSINLDEDLFFDYENGIHVAGKDFDDWRTANPEGSTVVSTNNYNRSGDSTEAKANLSFFKDSQEVLNQDVGVRINGGFSRYFPNKSLRIYARSEFGAGGLEYPFFTQLNYNSYKTLVLRNSGNDVNKTYFRDAFIQRSVAHMNLATQGYEPAVVYLNGEYWGMLNFCERYDKHYFKRVYGIETDQLDFLEYDGTLIQEGDNAHYLSMINYLQSHDLSEDAHYDYIKTQLDPDNFTDFFITNIYASNLDWPHNNVEFWRKHNAAFESEAPYGQDGRWRWVLKDTDFGFGNSDAPNAFLHNTLSFATSVGGDPITNPEWSTFLFRKLLENNTFKTNFINRFADMINTTFQPDRLNGMITAMAQVIAGEIEAHGQRWQSINSLAQWNDNVAVMTEFANQRPQYQRDHIREKFGIAENVALTLDVNDAAGGYIKINTIEILPTTPGVSPTPYPWTGIYFKDVRVTLRAIPNDGYAFSYWSGDVESFEAEITVTPQQAATLVAHFTSTAPITDRVPVYFWALDSSLPNLSLLSSIDASFEQGSEATLQYTSCLDGYPFEIGHPNWGKAALTKIDSPTAVNYIPEANYGIEYANAGIRGIMITQPFHSDAGDNTLTFHLPTTGYQNIIVSFAAKNYNAADAIVLDYSVAHDGDHWIRTGLPFAALPLQNDYTLYTADMTTILAINNNPDFKVRIRFTGPDMTLINGGRVYFNNVSLIGSPVFLGRPEQQQTMGFGLYPNPFSDVVQVKHGLQKATYRVFTIDGRMVKNGELSTEINLSGLSSGVYLFQVSADGKTQTKKLVKK